MVLLKFPRRNVSEKMDDPGTPDEEVGRALDAIARAHRWFGSYRSIHRSVETIGSRTGAPIRVLDVGAGGGDLGRSLHARYGDGVTYVRMDPSERVLWLRKPPRDRPICARSPRFPFPDHSMHLVVSQLVLHHLTDEEIPAFLRSSRRVARHRVIHQDLVRSRLFYGLFRIFARLFTSSHVFHHDGPVSIQRSRTLREWESFLKRQSLESFSVERVFPWRLNLTAAAAEPSPHSMESPDLRALSRSGD